MANVIKVAPGNTILFTIGDDVMTNNTNIISTNEDLLL